VIPNPSARGLSRYGREIAWVLLVKAAAIYLLWTLFFSPAHQVHPTSTSTAEQVFGAAPITPPRSKHRE